MQVDIVEKEGLKNPFRQHEILHSREVIYAAVERLIEVIGEAANRVSKDFQQNHPEMPWRKIVG